MTRPTTTWPFLATVRLPSTLGEAQLDITLSGVDRAGPLEQADKAFSTFAAAADGGFLAGSRVPPTQSLFQIVASESTAGALRYRCRVRGIDPGGFQVLLNILAECCRRHEPLREVRLAGTLFNGAGKGPREILEDPLPGRPPTAPFELSLGEYYFENREPVIRMEFQQAVRDEQFDRVKALMDVWDQLLMLGGYPEPPDEEAEESEPGEGGVRNNGETTAANEPPRLVLPEPGELYLVEPTVLEHILHAVQVAEEAYDAVISMAVKLHSTGCPLVALEIE